MKISQRMIAVFVTFLLLATQCYIVPASADGVGFLETFESDLFTLGQTINGINGWSANANFKLAKDQFNDANHALLLDGKYESASRSFDPFTNVGTGSLIDISYRLHIPVDNYSGTTFRVKAGSKTPIVIGYGPLQKGTTYNGIVLGSDTRSFYLPIKSGQEVNEGNVPAGNGWPLLLSPSSVTSQWYYFRMQIDLTAGVRSTDVYVATQKITDQMIEEKTGLSGYTLDVPFREDHTDFDAISGIEIKLAKYGGSKCYVDDIMVTLSGQAIEPDAKYNVQEGSAKYSISGNSVNVQANVIMPVVGVGSAKVLAAVYGADNELLAVDSSFECDKTDLDGDVISFNKTLTANGAAVKQVKLFVWKSYETRIPYCSVVECIKVAE